VSQLQERLQNVRSVRGDSYGHRAMKRDRRSLRDRLAGGIDLMIDFATLGEYGLEPVPAFDAGCEGSGRTTGWEALAPAQRRSCDRPSDRCPAAAAAA
jgi:hypothetical protein